MNIKDMVGKKVTCNILGRELKDCRLLAHNIDYLILQNEMDGVGNPYKREYKHAWFVGCSNLDQEYDQEIIRKYNIKLEEKKMNIKEKRKLYDYLDFALHRLVDAKDYLKLAEKISGKNRELKDLLENIIQQVEDLAEFF